MNLALSILFIVSAAVAETSRPMSEMHGDCSHYAVNLSKEIGLWSQQAVQVKSQVGAVPIAMKLELTLVNQKEVKYTVPPAKTFPTKEPRGGIFSFEVPESGQYRVSAGSKIWYDVVDVAAKKIVQATSFEMQTQCKTIFKTVAYELVAGRKYQLQVSSSDAAVALMMVTQVN